MGDILREHLVCGELHSQRCADQRIAPLSVLLYICLCNLSQWWRRYRNFGGRDKSNLRDFSENSRLRPFKIYWLVIEIRFQISFFEVQNRRFCQPFLPAPYSLNCVWTRRTTFGLPLSEHVELRLVCQPVYQSSCSTFRHSWIPPKVLELLHLPLTCSIRFLELLERHNTWVFSLLIFIPALWNTAEKRSSACWRLCWEDPHSAKSSAKSKRLFLQLPAVTPSSAQLWLSIQFMYYNTRLKRSGDRTHPCRSLTPTVNACDLINSADTDTNFWAGIEWHDCQ